MMSSTGSRENSLHQFVADPSDGVCATPAVKLLCAPVPVRDDVVCVAHEDSVMRHVEKPRSLAQLALDGLILQNEKSRNADRKNADNAARERRAFVLDAVLDREGEHRQHDAPDAHDEHTALLAKTGGDQHDNDVQNGDGIRRRREGVDEENYSCQRSGGERKQSRG